MSTIEVKVPDIGDFTDIPIIEIFVKPGDTVAAEDSLVSLESDKATMDVPSPAAGTVKELRVKLGDKVSEGSLIVVLEADGAGAAIPVAGAAAAPSKHGSFAPTPAAAPVPAAAPTPAAAPNRVAAHPAAPVDEEAFKAAHASPSVRKFARDLGVELARVTATGPKNRILQDDVQKFVKQLMSGAGGAGGAGGQISGGAELNLLPWPKVDFAKFGPFETQPLSRIKKISGANLARNWVMIPHVTQFDEADITDLEAFRVALNKENEKAGTKLTMLAFLIRASVAALKKFPDVNASLDGDNLVVKQYYHIGFAADTPNGLVVPVIRNADQKGVLQIAKEMGELQRERLQLDIGLLELNTDLRAAMRERSGSHNIDEAQQKSREGWLAYRKNLEMASSKTMEKGHEQTKGTGLEENRGKAKDKGHSSDGPDDDFSM